MYIYTIYIYIYTKREREKERESSRESFKKEKRAKTEQWLQSSFTLSLTM